MDSHNQVLSLLGLCLRGGNLAVGEAPVASAVQSRRAHLILLASDAAGNTVRRAGHFAEAGQCPVQNLTASKAELGHALGRASVALAAVTDAGLAASVLKKCR